MKLASAIHQRGHAMLLELERIVLDPTQPIAARIMAARTALPFILPANSTLRQLVNRLNALGLGPRDLIRALQAIKSSGALQAEIVVR